jgi:tetratricopeptide (TPR) repeat protein
MILKKVHFPIFVLLTLFLILQSCEKKTIKSTENQNDKAEIDALLKVAHKHFKNTKFDSSYYYFNKVKDKAIIKKDTSRIIHSFSFIAETEMYLGDYSSCEATAILAFPYLNKEKFPNSTWNIYNVLGLCYLYQYDYENALIYHRKALNLNVDVNLKNNSLNNIAFVYIEMEKYLKAIQILQPITLKKEFKNQNKIYIFLDNIGYSYFKMGDPKAIHYLTESLKLRKINNDEWGLITSYSRLAEYHLKENPSLAHKYARLAFDKASNIHDVNDQLISLTLLIKSSEESQLKFYSEKYIHINDSITRVRQIAKNQFAKIKYDSKKEKEENLLLKTQKAETALQLEEHKNRNLILYFIVAMGIAATGFISFYLIAKNKREKIKTSYDTEIRIAKKLHDELANDVYHTIAFAEKQDMSSSQNKEILLTNLDTIYSRTRNISKENSTIDTGLHFVVGLKEMMSNFNTDAVTILINGMDAVDWNALETNKKIIVYRVLQELLVNMKKHSQSSVVVIAFKKNENKLQIDYSDNGLGAASYKINSRNGLQNVKNRILAIKGSITFDTKPGKGFKSSFAIPI